MPRSCDAGVHGRIKAMHECITNPLGCRGVECRLDVGGENSDSNSNSNSIIIIIIIIIIISINKIQMPAGCR